MENTRRGFLATAAAALAGVGLLPHLGGTRKVNSTFPVPQPEPQSPCWNCGGTSRVDTMGRLIETTETKWFGPDDELPYQPQEIPATIFPYVQAPCPQCRPLEWKGFLQGCDPEDRAHFEWYARTRWEKRAHENRYTGMRWGRLA